MRFQANQTMTASQPYNNKAGWGQIGIAYLLYVVAMSLIQPLASHSFQFDELSGLLLAYFVACLLSVGYLLTLGKRTRQSLGMETTGFLSQQMLGWGLAIVSILVVWGVNLGFTSIQVSFNQDFQPLIFSLLLVGFIFQGFMEEFLLRGLIQNQIAMAWGVPMGILLNSLIFSLGHWTNASASPLSSFNTFLIALVFSLAYYYHDSLWVVGAFHSGWNFLLGPVLGNVVSGFKLPTSFLKSEPVAGMEGLSGGAYGFEASYPTMAVCLVLIGIYLILIHRKNSRLTQAGQASEQRATK